MKYWAECCCKLMQGDNGLYFRLYFQCTKIRDHAGQCGLLKKKDQLFIASEKAFAQFSKWQIEVEGLDPRNYQPILHQDSTPALAKARCFY